MRTPQPFARLGGGQKGRGRAEVNSLRRGSTTVSMALQKAPPRRISPCPARRAPADPRTDIRGGGTSGFSLRGRPMSAAGPRNVRPPIETPPNPMTRRFFQRPASLRPLGAGWGPPDVRLLPIGARSRSLDIWTHTDTTPFPAPMVAHESTIQTPLGGSLHACSANAFKPSSRPPSPLANRQWPAALRNARASSPRRGALAARAPPISAIVDPKPPWRCGAGFSSGCSLRARCFPFSGPSRPAPPRRGASQLASPAPGGKFGREVRRLPAGPPPG